MHHAHLTPTGADGHTNYVFPFLDYSKTTLSITPVSPPLLGVDGLTGYSHSQITLTYYFWTTMRLCPFTDYSLSQMTPRLLYPLSTNTPGPDPNHYQVLMATQVTPILRLPFNYS